MMTERTSMDRTSHLYPQTTRRVLILMAHTGGGHLRAAQAIAEALHRRHGDTVSTQVVDVLGQYAPFPFNHLDHIYPWWIKHAVAAWRWGYRLTDSPTRAMALLRLFWPLVWPRARSLVHRYPADVIVSAHPLSNHYLVWTLNRLGRTVPFATLVTDPVSVHPFWLTPGVTRCLVGSAQARRKALACGLVSDQIQVTGLPIDPLFVDGLTDRISARVALGWPLDMPTVLLLGGGEGMGQLYQIARAIDAACQEIQLAVVAGRNRPLRARLKATPWQRPTHVYGFVSQMSRLMSAADLIVTKAGPGTIHEAFIAGRPLILTGAIPGQEYGNVHLVVKGGAGAWAPTPLEAATLVARWTGPERKILSHMATRARALAHPHAAADAADEIWRLANPTI